MPTYRVPKQKAAEKSPGFTAVGQDGGMWKVVVRSNGRHGWEKEKPVKELSMFEVGVAVPCAFGVELKKAKKEKKEQKEKKERKSKTKTSNSFFNPSMNNKPFPTQTSFPAFDAIFSDQRAATIFSDQRAAPKPLPKTDEDVEMTF